MGRYSDFASAFDKGLKAASAPFDEAGPAIEVSPFAPGEATTGSGILRAITAVAGARRDRANWELAQRDKATSRYKDALQTEILQKSLDAPDYRGMDIEERKRHNLELERLAGERNKRPVRGAAGAKPTAAGLKLGLDTLTKEGDAWVEEQMRTPRVGVGGKRDIPIVDTLQLTLKLLGSPVYSKRLEAAKALGVKPLSEPAAEATPGKDGKPVFEMVPVLKNGLPVFDAKDVSAAAEKWLETRRAGLRDQWRQRNAPRISAYEAATRNLMFGDVQVDEEADPLEEAALELFGDE